MALQFLGLALLSAWLGAGSWQPIENLQLDSVDLRVAWESPWLAQLSGPDPAVEAIVNDYLDGLSAAGFSREAQGVWLATGKTPIAQSQGDQRFPAASLTKIATTLAALSTWGPEHSFETLVGWRGQLADGVIQGDLIIQGNADPLFVWEEAIALGNALQRLGVRRVTGDLVIVGSFTMNFQTDTLTAGQLLQQAMNTRLWSSEVWQQYQTMAPTTAQPQVQIEGQVQVANPERLNQVSGWLVRHRSLPLAALLKAMNIYSNNAMAELIADSLGGPSAVIQTAEALARVSADEIELINGSGLGEQNQISARAVVAMLQAIQAELQPQDLTIADLFPIAGADGGTLDARKLPPHAALKTGSLASVSALAGAFPTEQKGIVWFALINYGSGLEELRTRQDRLLAALEQRWGRAEAVPPGLKTTIQIGQGDYQLGDPRRNQDML